MFSPLKRSFQLVVVAVAFCSALPPAASAQPAQPVPGGLTRLYLWPENSVNLIANPSFEQTALGLPTYWTLGGGSGYLFLDTIQKRSGTRSLHLRNSHLAPYTPMATQRLTLPPGWYNLRGYVKTVRAGSNANGSGGRITLWKGKGGESTEALGGTTTSWTLLDRNSFLVEAGDKPQIRLEAYRKPNGDVYFDDVALHRLVPPFLEGFLLYPNYRGHLFQDRSQIVRVSVTARPEVLGRSEGSFLVRTVLQTAAGVTVSSVDNAVRANIPTTISLNATSAPLGRLSLRMLAIDSVTRVPFFEYPAYAVVKSAASVRSTLKTYVDIDNALVIDGRRRFALGIYDTSGRSTLTSYYETRVKKIAEAPFNLYLNYWLPTASKAELSALTTTLRKYGMSYLHTANAWYESHANWPSGLECAGTPAQSLGEDSFTACKGRELRDLDGLAGWYTADERAADQTSPVFDQYVLLRNNDPDGVTFIAQNRPKELARWRDAADVMGLDPYPIYNIPLGQLSPFEMVTDWVEIAQGSVQRSRPVWAVIQFFQFGSQGHWPTYQELRTMSYMAIIAGAKGLFYWSNGAVGLEWVKDPVLKEQYWQRLVKLTKEIRALEAVLLAPDSTTVLTSVSDITRIRVMTKQVGTVRYVFAVNASAQSVNVQFRLSQAATRADVREEGRILPATSGIFADSFLPYAVHVYQIPPTQPTP